MSSPIESFLEKVRSLDKNKVSALLAVDPGPGGKALVKELMQDYLDYYPPKKGDILKTYEEKNFKSLRHEMHGLKSASGNIGGMKLFSLCDQIENITTEESNENSLKKMQKLIEEFKIEFSSFEDELNKFCALLNDNSGS